jgi:hypothetical protein
MIYFLWFPFAMAIVCFASMAAQHDIPTERKRHALTISLGFAGLAAAVAQPIRDPWAYVVPIILALMACERFMWEAAEWQRQQIS